MADDILINLGSKVYVPFLGFVASWVLNYCRVVCLSFCIMWYLLPSHSASKLFSLYTNSIIVFPMFQIYSIKNNFSPMPGTVGDTKISDLMVITLRDSILEPKEWIQELETDLQYRTTKIQLWETDHGGNFPKGAGNSRSFSALDLDWCLACWLWCSQQVGVQEKLMTIS